MYLTDACYREMSLTCSWPQAMTLRSPLQTSSWQSFRKSKSSWKLFLAQIICSKLSENFLTKQLWLLHSVLVCTVYPLYSIGALVVRTRMTTDHCLRTLYRTCSPPSTFQSGLPLKLCSHYWQDYWWGGGGGGGEGWMVVCEMNGPTLVISTVVNYSFHVWWSLP